MFQGSAFPAPSRLPTMSASPSPPHISDSAAIPPGLVRQKHAVTVSRTSVYMNGPPSSSFLSPSRETARTAFSFATTPEPMANSRTACSAGTSAAKSCDEVAPPNRGHVSMKNGPDVVWITLRLSLRSSTSLDASTSNSFTHRYAATAAPSAAPASRAAESPSAASSASTTPAARGRGGPCRPDGANENAESDGADCRRGASATPTAATTIVRPRDAETQRRGVCVLSRAVPTATGG